MTAPLRGTVLTALDAVLTTGRAVARPGNHGLAGLPLMVSLACLVGLYLPGRLASAAMVVRPLIDGNMNDLGWDAIYDDRPQGDMSFLDLRVESVDRDSLTINLVKTVTFTRFADIAIEFRHVRGPAPTDLREETFFMMKEVVTNKTPARWAGFGFTIEDRNIRPSLLDPRGGRRHPAKAHLHNTAWDPASGPFRVTDPLTQNGLFAMNLGLKAGSDPIGRNGSWTGERLRMHDFVDPNPVLPGTLQRMNFVLFERPVAVPEPSTLTLAGLGVLGFLGAAWRRCRAIRTEGTQPAQQRRPGAASGSSGTNPG